MRALVFFVLTFIAGLANAADEAWTWLRAETGLPHPVVMQGRATTVSAESNKWVLRLSSQDKAFDDFIVRVRRSGKDITAEFEPPNTERVTLSVSGTFRVSPLGDGTSHEEMVLANTMNGNFLVISRIRPKK